MSTTTTNYGIVLPDGNDTFNPLTFNNNAFVKVDSQMKKNQDNATTTATHIYIDGVNTILRSVATANTIIFIASADYVAGSTIAIDGVTCTFRYADGTAPKSGAFKTNQAVMCYLNGTILTMISAGNIPDLTASDIEYDNAETGLDATTVQEAVDSLNTSLTNLKYGKLLWNGSFTDGSITITNGANYKFFVVIVGYMPCFGTKDYGIGGALGYGAYSIDKRGYRVSASISGSDLIWTIDSINRGGSNGTSSETIQTIYGLC